MKSFISVTNPFNEVKKPCFLISAKELKNIEEKYGFDEFELAQLQAKLGLAIEPENKKEINNACGEAYNLLKKALFQINKIQRIEKELIPNVNKNSTSNQTITDAKHIKKCVGCKKGTASIELKNNFSLKQTYVNELFTLALFWISRKGKIPKTRPESQTKKVDNFYTFCSEIIGDEKLTATAIFEKFNSNYNITYSW